MKAYKFWIDDHFTTPFCKPLCVLKFHWHHITSSFVLILLNWNFKEYTTLWNLKFVFFYEKASAGKAKLSKFYLFAIIVNRFYRNSVVDKAVDQWCPRLRTHVCDNGHHFWTSAYLNCCFFVLNFRLTDLICGDYNFCYTFRRTYSIVCVRRLSNEASEALRNYFLASNCY